MARGMKPDLAERFAEAERTGLLVTAESESDARRLRAGVARKELVSPATNVFARARHWQALRPPQRALHVMRTLAALHPSWVFCGFSAALVHGLSVSYPLIDKIHVATTHSGRSHDSRGIARHVIRSASVQEVGGIKVTSLERTAFDCLRNCSFRNGLAIADSVLRTGSLSQDELLSAFERMSGRFPRKQRAVSIMELADGRAESGGESVARAVIIERGFRLPELQHVITDPITGKRRRVDFFWEQRSWPSVIGELDGHDKYLDPTMTGGRTPIDVLADERLRESRISLADARIVRFSYAQATNASYFVRLLSTFGVPRDANIPDVALDPRDREATLTRHERLFVSRLIGYVAEQRTRAA